MGVLAWPLCDLRQVTSLSVPQSPRMVTVLPTGLWGGEKELLLCVGLRRLPGHSKCSVSVAEYYDFPGLGQDREHRPLRGAACVRVPVPRLVT